MLKLTTTLILLLTVVFLLQAAEEFNPEHYFSKTLILCFTRDAVGNDRGVIDFQIRNGMVETGLTSFDALAAEYSITEMKQIHPVIKHPEWNDNGAYLQNIYRIKLASDDRIKAAVEALNENEHLIWADYETIHKIDFEPNDPQYPTQWHLPKIQSPEAWDWTTGSDEIIVGIVDSGVLWTHPDLQDNIWVNQAELDAGMTINWTNGQISGGNGVDDDGNGKVDDVIGWNFYNNNNNTYQTTSANDHGTHVAGCAGAVGNNGIGVSGATMTVKLMVSRHTGSAPDTSIYSGYDGIIYCADTGAHIINCSWGGPGGGPYANTVINYATNQGSMVVGAAGNDNVNNDITHHYPSDANNCLSVAATDQNDEKTYFSNYGTCIDVSCPGIDIKSTIIANNSYGSYQGTSMSSPIVAGAAALALSVHPELIGLPVDLRERVMMTTDYIDHLNPGFEGMLGTGRLNSYQLAMFDLIPSISIDSYDFYEYEGDGDGLPNPGETCNLEIMLQNGWFAGGLWAQANDVTVTLTANNPEVTIISGTETFGIDILWQGGSFWNDDDPFQIITPEDTNIYDLSFNVNITANLDTAFPYEVNHELDIQLTMMQDGWPYDIGGTSTSSGIIADIDNSGDKEVIFGDHNGNIHVVNLNGDPFGNFPINFGSNISSAVAVADLNNDGFKEIVFNNEAGLIQAVDYEGNTFFTAYNVGGIFKGNPIIADVDGNDTMEIIAVSFTGNQAVILNADGSLYPNFPVTLASGGTLGSPAVGDLDGDGHLEVLASSLSGDIYAISSATGQNITGWPYNIGTNSWKGPIVANLDSDNDPEVLIAAGTGNIVAVNHDGSVLFERNLSTTIKTCPVVADLNGDQSVEAVIVANNGDIYVLDSNGNDYGIFPVSYGEAVESDPVLADMDGNGTIDIVFGENEGYLHSIDLTGAETVNFPIYLGSSIKVGAAMSDADGDGDPEIIIPNQNEYVLLDYKRDVANTSIAWSAFKRNPQRTGNAFDPTNGSSDDVTPAFVNNLSQNYPNPFNPTTIISFSLEKPGYTTLKVYNILGQLVNTLVSDNLSQGYHVLEWNGRDTNNKAVGSGLYFYKIQSGYFTSTRKMVLMK